MSLAALLALCVRVLRLQFQQRAVQARFWRQGHLWLCVCNGGKASRDVCCGSASGSRFQT